MKIDLKGEWGFRLGEYKDVVLEEDLKHEVINLPSTTEISKKGEYKRDDTQTLYLSRNYPFTGKSCYKRIIEIPKEWEGMGVKLILERTKFTKVFWDGKNVSSSYETVAPQVHKLCEKAVKGKHELIIEVDNDLAAYAHFPKSLYGGHQYTEHTQTNWNGILGEIYIESISKIEIEQVSIRKDKDINQVITNLKVNSTESDIEADFELRIGDQLVNFKQRLASGENQINYILETEEALRLWDEFEPYLYEVIIKVSYKDVLQDCFKTKSGFRDVEVKEKRIWINNQPIFLRGNVDCAIFPLTGAAPMEGEEWHRIFKVLKDYGMNHCRFHSWCPPEKAFQIADQMGIYLQIELSCFANGLYEPESANYDEKLETYLYEQAKTILEVYGNHPSFLMFAVGNEMIGDSSAFEKILRSLKQIRPDKLYSQGSNDFLEHPKFGKEDDFWVTMRTKERGHNIRASFSNNDLPLGHIQTKERQGTMVTYEEAVQDSGIPLIAHEVGQYQVFPDFNEEKEYTGVTYPSGLMVCKGKLRKKGMLGQAKDFFEATGKLAAQCYKEDIEASLRTRGMSGFQLLSLQDFPGQGMALVGVLDSFWQSKGLISPSEWRMFCNDQVVLAKLASYVYEEKDEIEVEVGIYNYGKRGIERENLKIQLMEENKVLKEVEIENVSAKRGKMNWLGKVTLSADEIAGPCECQLVLKYGILMNQYPIWIYPKKVEIASEKVYVAAQLDEKVEEALQQGKNVVALSDDLEPSIEADFTPDFWCYPMFKSACEENGVPVAPGTMGLLINEKHPALKLFPTQSYSSWQWQQIAVNAHPVILDECRLDYKMIVQVIDNFDRNHKLGLIYEREVNGAKLIICAMNLLDYMQIPEVRQLYNSLINYANEK